MKKGYQQGIDYDTKVGQGIFRPQMTKQKYQQVLDNERIMNDISKLQSQILLKGRGKAVKKYLTGPVQVKSERYDKKTDMKYKIEHFNATHAQKIEPVYAQYRHVLDYKNLTHGQNRLTNNLQKQFE